jgi:uncharacterized protein YfaS (alpha-2-macroglobulin family)
MAFGLDRRAVTAIAATLIVGFGGGFLTAKVLPQGAGKPASESSDFRWPWFGKVRDAKAPRAGAAKPEGFAVWRTRVDTAGAEPLACIEMTRDLNPAASYGDFVQLTPDPGRAPAVTAKGAELCVRGGGFYGHRITLLKGLKAANGETLAANADVDFTFGEKPPYVGFEGQGVILPRDEADGLGIETVNVSKLAIEVWRVPDRNLVRRQISAPDPTPEDEYSDDYGEDSANGEGRRVWKGTMAVTGKAGERTVTVFPLGAVLKEMKPGAYVVKARNASGEKDNPGKDEDGNEDNRPAQARRWVVFTDMALIAYQGSDGLDLVVRSLKTAKTLSGVKLTLVSSNGEDLAAVQTDANGRARFADSLMHGDGAERARMVMAYGAQLDFAVLDLDRSPVDLSGQGMGGRQVESPTAGREAKTAVDGYLYADRGVYRPGETVHMVGLVRDREAKAVAGRAGQLVVKRPSGVEFQRVRFKEAAGGAVAQDIVLPRTAPRGRWRVSLEMDGSDQPAGEASFSVEDFAPQRLAVTATGDEARPLGVGEVRQIQVAARFLYGASGAGLQTEGEARIRADGNPFPQHKDFRWGDEQTRYEEQLVEFPATVTDGDGRAVEAFDAGDLPNTPVPLLAQVATSVFEPGGRPVRDGLTLKLRGKPLYLGVKATPGGSSSQPTQTFEMISVDPTGRRIAATGVTWTLISENWNYDWFQKDGRWQWRRTSRDSVIAKGQVNITAAQAAQMVRRLPWGDYRFVLEESKSGARTVIRLASGWGEPTEGETAPDVARVTAGTKAYVQGDTVEVTLKAPYAGEAQVAVATDRLIDFKTVSVGKDGATVRLKTNAAWGGGAYVLVSIVQPRDPAVTPKPRRALGLVYVPLDPKNRKLTVALGTPAKLNSKAPVQVPVEVKGLKFGGKARVTVAAVDEGILQLTRQESPDPVKWYFGKRALTLNYRDDYGRLLDPNLGAAGAVNFGGDEIGGAGLTATPIKTVALWSGVVETGRDGKATVNLPAADFNGQLRIMAVAWTDDAVGSASADMTVRQPVVAELSLPRFLAPGDQAQATVELHNVEGRPGAYTAEVSGAGGLLAPFRKLYQLMLGQRVVERSPLNAPNVAGIGRVDFKVSGPGFTDAKSYPLQTRLGWGPVTRTSLALQRPGETFTPAPALMQGLAAGTVSMTVSYSPFRGFDPAPIAEHLSRYPYGCTEQLISVAYPLIYAADLTTDPKLRRAPAALAQAVNGLLDRQSLDGSFGLWRPGDGEADAWIGASATDFLVEAKARGVQVPDQALDRALAAMRRISKPQGYLYIGYRTEYPPTWMSDPALSKVATAHLRTRAAAYALYVLAKAGSGDLARLRWFHDVQMKDEPSPLARAHVGAGLALMGDRARAHSAFEQAVKALGYREPSDWYQSPLRDLGGVIALAYEAGETGIARQLQARLDGAVKDPDALNTQEEARLLQAADRMLRAAGAMRINTAGVTGAGPSRWRVGRLADAKLTNAGTGALWRTVTVRGTSLGAPPSSSSGVTVQKTLYTLNGGAAPLEGLSQGARVIVRLSGQSLQGQSMLAVVDDALPAGFEIETVLGPEDAQDGPFKFLGKLTSVSVQEKRDDRYVAAMNLEGRKDFAVAYVARATTPGDFLLPGAEARDMYRPAVNARTAAGRVRIAPGS